MRKRQSIWMPLDSISDRISQSATMGEYSQFLTLKNISCSGDILTKDTYLKTEEAHTKHQLMFTFQSLQIYFQDTFRHKCNNKQRSNIGLHIVKILLSSTGLSCIEEEYSWNPWRWKDDVLRYCRFI